MIPRFPDSPIPRFPDSPIPGFPDSPFPVLKIAHICKLIVVYYIINYLSCEEAN